MPDRLLVEELKSHFVNFLNYKGDKKIWENHLICDGSKMPGSEKSICAAKNIDEVIWQ